MLIAFDDEIISAMTIYCKRNNISLEKIMQESIIQYQLRHRINDLGEVYSKGITKIGSSRNRVGGF
jgi:hypothetical protein